MIEFIHQELTLSGQIDYVNAEQYYQKGLAIIQANKNFPIVVNLENLEHGSTLALAVLVRWLRQTPNAQGLQLKAVPEKMIKIIQACHLHNDLQFVA